VNPKILVLHHFYHPDNVVGAQQFTGLCEGLASNNWEVQVWPGNRGCHDAAIVYPTKPEIQNGVLVRRVWRPAFRQHSFLGRIFNSIWMQKAWAWRLLLHPSYKPDIILTGTDPIFTVGLSNFLKFLGLVVREPHPLPSVKP
jgi:hypothetical protein